MEYFFFTRLLRSDHKVIIKLTSTKESVPLHIPRDIWQPLVEIRAQLDASCPGAPTPIEEALREIINHYRRCTVPDEELEAFCKRAQSWKGKTIQ